MLQDSRIQSTVSLDGNGKRYGHLIAPNSTQRSAYGAEMIPIVVIRNGDGPGYLLTGGVHGDEYEGPIALMKIARELDPDTVNGLVVIIPSLNLQAVVAASRLSPIDGSNLNRVFPGDRLGNFSEALADFVVRGIFPHVDFVSDLHAGGSSLEYLPLTMMHRTDDEARNAKSLACMKAFGAPVALFSVDQEPDGLLEWNAEIRGKVVVAAELGGAGRVTPGTVEIAETGIRNVLAFAGILDAPIVPPEAMGRAPTRMMATPDLDCLVLAPDDGMFEPVVTLEDDVVRGQPLGRLHDPRHPDRAPMVIEAPRPGTIICQRPLPMTRLGDCLYIIADDLDE
jgi:N-alpha-acetyl-L-2,4-diaminobutyrate deacetylase